MKKYNILILSLIIFSIHSTLQAQKIHPLQATIEHIIANKNATIGVAINYDDIDSLLINNEEQYPTMSTYKLPITIALLHYLEEKNIKLDDSIYIHKAELHKNTYSPFKKQYTEGNFYTTYREIIKYTVSFSDNNTCDILIKHIGGIKYVENYIKSIGINNLSFNATEYEMGQKFENQYLNWITPHSYNKLLYSLINHNILSISHLKFLWEAMIQTSTGLNKIKGLLPENTIVGHKTGNSSRNKSGLKIADNDFGFILLPNGKLLYITILVKNSTEDDETNAAIIAEISKAAFDYYTKTKHKVKT